MKRLLSLALAIISFSALAQNNPIADPAAVVEYGNARFMVLSDRLIRISWAQSWYSPWRMAGFKVNPLCIK